MGQVFQNGETWVFAGSCKLPINVHFVGMCQRMMSLYSACPFVLKKGGREGGVNHPWNLLLLDTVFWFKSVFFHPEKLSRNLQRLLRVFLSLNPLPLTTGAVMTTHCNFLLLLCLLCSVIIKVNDSIQHASACRIKHVTAPAPNPARWQVNVLCFISWCHVKQAGDPDALLSLPRQTAQLNWSVIRLWQRIIKVQSISFTFWMKAGLLWPLDSNPVSIQAVRERNKPNCQPSAVLQKVRWTQRLLIVTFLQHF